MTAKDIKKVAFVPIGTDSKGNIIGRYMFPTDLMQAFEEAIINEYRESILSQLEADAKEDRLGTLESILISVGNAPKPTT